MAEILKTGEAMERALALLEAGEVVAIPTETVYGLAGDATNGEAVARIFEAKGRPRFNPLIAHVSGLAMAAGADFIKTSTGKVTPAATLPVTLVMMEAARDFQRRTGRMVGIKPAGGIRTAKEAIGYLVVLYETLGPRWMTPDLFRFGASSLLNDVLMQIRKQRTGQYQGPDYFTID